MEQTAVEWLVEILKDCNYLTKDADHLFEEAKEIDKQNIENAWTKGNCNTDLNGNPSKHYAISGEQYYNETFNKK